MPYVGVRMGIRGYLRAAREEENFTDLLPRGETITYRRLLGNEQAVFSRSHPQAVKKSQMFSHGTLTRTAVVPPRSSSQAAPGVWKAHPLPLALTPTLRVCRLWEGAR